MGAGRVYDLVIAGGRVMDPESGLDAVRNIGVLGGRVESISEEALSGHDTVHAGGLVVAPQIPHLRLLGWLLWAYSRCGVSTGVLIGLCAASLRGLATVSRQLWSLSG